MQIKISTPRDFNFRRTALSHGWSNLLPFHLDKTIWTLRCVLPTAKQQPVTAVVSSARKSLLIEVNEKLSARSQATVVRAVRHIFRLDDDLSDFFLKAGRLPEFEWITHNGAGRMLRAPTVFEDLVKTLCTTNCTWALTRVMVTALVEKLGAETRDGLRAFPTAEVMVKCDEAFYRAEIRAGYRANYLCELAERVASGALDPESWLTSDLPTALLKKELKRVKGVGDYAADNLLKLLGRYDVLALDSWVRPQFYKLRHGGEKCDDAAIAEFYAGRRLTFANQNPCGSTSL